MPKKLTYGFVKDYIESFKYKLLSTEYINNNTKLELLCPKSHKFWMSFDCFKRGQRHPRYNRLLYEDVKNSIESVNYKLLSTKYVNAHTKMELMCDNGHKFWVTWGAFQQGAKCPECNKLLYEDVKNYIKSFGYKLLSTTYVKSGLKLKIKCDRNHIYKATWSNFYNGHRCPECNRLSKCLNIKDLQKQTLDIAKNYKLLSTKYINSKTKLEFLCDRNHKFWMTWNNFKQGHRCPECLKRNYTEEELTKLKNYRSAVTQSSEQNYKKYYKLINPNNLERGRSKYNLDHIFPVIEGFKRNISVKYISNPFNLQMLSERKNLIKQDKPWQSEKEMYRGYIEFQNKLERV